MEKSTSDTKQLPRRSPRTGPSAALLAAKENMKLRGKKGKDNDFIKDDYAVAQNAKHKIATGTGIVYDDDMVNHYCLWDENYPECPKRFTSVIARCNELGLIDRCTRISSRKADKKEILMLHTPEVINTLKETENNKSVETLEKLSSHYDSIYINNETYRCSLLAVGSTIDLVDAVINEKIQNGMAVVRPPGHHAMKDEYCGYCFFNNVALAAQHALDNCGLKRILIVDWDVHHGQGTQQMFYDDPRVVYFSIHRYEHGAFWPELRESDFYYIGDKKGMGYNFNVPLNSIGMKDADYLAIFQQVLLPMAYEFQPELVLVSAGYDAAIGCPEFMPELVLVSAGYDSALGDEKGQMELTSACYGHLLSPLMGLAGGKIAVVLEGGYCLKSLAEGTAHTLRILLGDPVPKLIDFGTPSDSIVETILNVICAHKPFWQCFQIQDTYMPEPSFDSGVRVRKRSTEKIPPSIPLRKHLPTVSFQGSEIKPTSFQTRNCYPVQSQDFVEKVNERLDYLKMATDLSIPPNRVALTYSEKMTEHKNQSERNHPEKPERILKIFMKHKEYELLDRCFMVEPREATEEEILLVHSQSHLDDMKQTKHLSDEDLRKKEEKYDSVYLNQKSYDCALLAAGSVLQVVDSVLNGEARSGVAIVRPPGHHAEEDTPCGFCLFNNVSLAAKYAVEVHSLKRVLLLDWDVHHGNGTQQIFESDNRVLYISLHRYNNGKFFPSSTEGDFDKVGRDKGVGYNVNIPWNRPGGGMTDGDYIAAFFSVVMPIAYEFNPELVLVSAGFDACINDPLGLCKVSPEAYAHMTHWLTTLANGRVILSLEGGYNVTSISFALTLCTKALLGDPIPPLTGSTTPCASAVETIRNVLRTQEKYWSCLKFNAALPKENVLKNAGNGEDKTNVPKKGKPSTEVSDKLVEQINAMSIVESIGLKGDQRAAGVPEDGNPRNNAHSRDGRAGRDSDENGDPERPLRQTLVGYLSDNMQRLLNQEMFAVVPLPGCPHLVQVQAVPQAGIDVNTPCTTCESNQENWICLICYSVFCGRYVNRHMIFHNEETSHPLTLSFTDLSVWCYVCEAYIDNMVLYPAKNAVHRSKFGSDLEWSYGDRAPPTRLSSR